MFKNMFSYTYYMYSVAYFSTIHNYLIKKNWKNKKINIKCVFLFVT